MSNKPDIDRLQTLVNLLVTEDNNKAEVMRQMGVTSRQTIYDMIARAEKLGIVPTVQPPSVKAAVTQVKVHYEDKVRDLQQQLKTVSQDNLTASSIRSYYFGLTDRSHTVPDWTVDLSTPSTSVGVPILQWSDFHWGETVNPENVGGHNKYNLEIARKRLATLTERSIDLMTNHMVNPTYPGAVIILGGDMISGDIHEELALSNEGYTMEHVFDLFSNVAHAINAVADAIGRVHVVCVYGNHGRNTIRPRAKGSAYTNFDWMLYTMLEAHFKAAGDDRISFSIPEEPDCPLRIYNTTYLVTHGDKLGVRGGDGVIGMLSPIARGVKKIKSQYDALGFHVDWVVMGHFHTRMWLDDPGGIVNASLKGWDEFAKDFMRAPPNKASQNIWWNHVDHGPTFATQIFVERETKTSKKPEWISVLQKDHKK